MNDKVDLVAKRDNETDNLGSRPSKVELGQWFWVEDEDDGRWLGCATAIGSNYVEIESAVNRYTRRIHFKNFWEETEHEPNPETYIQQRIAHYQDRTAKLMAEVHEITKRLAIDPSQLLPSAAEANALVRVSNATSPKEYKAALIKAKEKELPDLFEKIKTSNDMMARWMKAQVIPLRAKAEEMREVIDIVDNRIFNVELYAGLVEEVKQIRKGNPAKLHEKVVLMQRRCYMDEECLANYETGGMEFKNLRAFDRWLAKKENMERILPFQRCIVAFRVRRNTKERECVNLSDFFSIVEKEDADKKTFLYMRNGSQLFRLETGIEFGAKLFPDTNHVTLRGGKIWAKMFASSIDELISDDEYQGRVEAAAKRKAENEEKRRKAKKEDKWKYRDWDHFDHDRYVAFTPASVMYDDISAEIQKQLRAHNRIMLVVQGLLDRSKAFHPHPPWQLYEAEGFDAAVELIYDDSRAIADGDKPDFEAYRARLNESLTKGSITVGQDDAWEIEEAVKESRRLDNDWRTRSHYRPERFRPYGNPGPGVLAEVASISKKKKTCTFRWERRRLTNKWDWNKNDWDESKIPVKFVCPMKKLLNVSAYTPGDFKQFFADPRTRAEYLKWAPLLLAAEEFHAGNRTIGPKDGD